MRYRLTRAAVIVAFTCATAQATFAQAVNPQTHGTPSRYFAKGSWQIVRNIGLDDDLLDNPGLIATDANRAVLFDFGTNVVKSIRLDGTLEWKTGGKGRGPGEYVNPLSLGLDHRGHVVIYDPENARITVLDRHGKFVRAVPLTERFEAALAGPTPSQFLLLDTESDTLVALADSIGMFRPVTMLPAEFRASARITRELTASIPTPLGHLLAFRWSSRMLLIDRDGHLLRSCTAIDSLSLPSMRKSQVTIQKAKLQVERVDATATPASRSMATLANWTAVLRPGVAADSQMTLDLYWSDCGKYRESRRLPIRTPLIGGNDDVLVAVVADPVPHLVVLRWIPSAK